MHNIWKGKELNTHKESKDNPLTNSGANVIEEFTLKELRNLEHYHDERIDSLYTYVQKLEDRVALMEAREANRIKMKQVRRLMKIKRGATPSNTLVNITADPVFSSI